MSEFFSEHFGFLSGAYSLAYAVVNGVGLRLIYPAVALLIYVAIESVIPKTRNSLASTVRSALYTATSLTINALLFSALYDWFDKEKLPSLFLVDLTPLTGSAHCRCRSPAGWWWRSWRRCWAMSSTTGFIAPSMPSRCCGASIASIIRSLSSAR
jgi:hypothetical protein